MLFTRINKSVAHSNRFVWFRRWVLERQIFKTLSRDSGLSIDTLQKIFYKYLDQAPAVKILRRPDINLRVDATYFKKFCVVLYQDDELSYTQLYRFTDAERYQEIKEDLENLIKLDVSIASITCDGHRATLKAIKKVMPKVIIQRCVVHVQRMCLLWITAQPKHQAGVSLRKLVGVLHDIKTHNDKLFWTREFHLWYQQHQDYLKEKTINTQTGRYWYKHKFLRRSYITIKRALPNMFHYLDHSKIPKSTNGIESFFGHLKNHLDLHRGLTLKHRMAFIKWYLYFKNQR